VVPFYLSASTRPSPSLNRDAPAVIKARIRTVTLACVVASFATLCLLIATAKMEPVEALHYLGWWPVDLVDIIRCGALTFLLYMGPLFEKIFIEQDLHDFRRGRLLVETLSSWQGYRNYVAGPITEEVIFRSVFVPIHLLAKVSPSKVVFLTPLYFGIAHVHHFYEFTLTHPHTPLLPAFLRSVFQFGYTTLFGWFASFLYVRTGSIYPCVIVHAFCNWVGLPRFWGRVRRREQYALSPVPLRGKDDEDLVTARGADGELGLYWSVVYYILLFAGAYAFSAALWPLTRSGQALAHFGSNEGHK